MAWLEKRKDTWHVNFFHGGRHYSRSLKTKSESKAKGFQARLEDNLADVERGRLVIPSGGDLMTVLLTDGKLEHKVVVKKELSFGELLDRYEAELPAGAKERSTRSTEKIHLQHFRRLIGQATAVGCITTETMQRYVNARAQEAGRRENPVSHVTIKKEIGTLASVWNRWASPLGLVTGAAPTKNLLYQKTKAKAPFQTLEQVRRQIERGKLTAEQQRELWDSVYLTLKDIEELLDHVKNDPRPFVYPMFVFAARTGARRSEMLRSQIDDFDFSNKMVRIREKKRDKTKELTFRHVPLSPLLVEVMMGWFAVHPGGSFSFCETAGQEIPGSMANHYFDWVLASTKWERLSGWHVFRHSFASNCAVRGIDQRMIDEWMGHQTEEMRRRYRHLFPHQQHAAMSLVFADGQ